MCPQRHMAAAAAAVFALGDDLLREVFIRLPASADLLRAAAACKPFLRAARSAPFLRRFRRRHPSSCPRLLGCLLLFPNRRRGKSHFVPISASFSSSSAAAAANCGDFALSLVPGVGLPGLGAATSKHLDCRHGRLLLGNLGSHELAGAHPISGRCVSLPAPPAGAGRTVGYGLSADGASSSSSSAAAATNGGDFALSFLPGGGWLGQGAATWKHLDCRNGRLLLENLESHELAVADPISRRFVSLPAPPARRAVGYGLFADDGDSSDFRVVCVSRDAASPELNGRLLLENLESHELAVADPISRRFVSLPAPPARRAVGYGLFADDGDSSDFRVVCVSRDAASPELRALVLASGELSWADVAGIACQPDLAAGSRVMQANRSLYWRLEGGERMVAFSTASMELSVLDLPPALRDLRFDAVDRGEEEDVNVLHLLTMSGFRVEVWAGTADADGGVAWRRVEKSMRFHKALTEMIDPLFQSYRDEVDVIGVAAGLVFFRQWNHLFSIDLETMELKKLPNVDRLGALTYPYTIAWPPSFLNPAGQGG